MTTPQDAIDLAQQQGGDYVRISYRDGIYYVTTDPSDPDLRNKILYQGPPDFAHIVCTPTEAQKSHGIKAVVYTAFVWTIFFVLTSCRITEVYADPDCHFPSWTIPAGHIVWIDYDPGERVVGETIGGICRRDTTGRISSKGEWSVIVPDGTLLCIEDYSTGILTDRCCTQY